MPDLKSYFRFFEKVDLLKKTNPKIKSLQAIYPQLCFWEHDHFKPDAFVTPIEVPPDEMSFLKLNFFIW